MAGECYGVLLGCVFAWTATETPAFHVERGG